MRTLTIALLTTALAAPALAQNMSPAVPVAHAPVMQPMTTTVSNNVTPVAAGGGFNKVFDEADTNHDNTVSKQEFEALADKHFAMADTNHDGKVTREEMQAQQNAIMQQMQQNLFGKGGNWQGKLNQFLGNPNTTTGAAPTTPVITSPSAPVVNPPMAPHMPSASY